MAELLVRFRGEVSCVRGPPPLGLTLSGATAEHPGEPTVLAFSGAAPDSLPAALTDAVVEPLDATRYRITSRARDWVVSAAAVHLHRDVAVRFYRAVPPRRVSLLKRAFWRVVLTLAASRAGLKLLATLRR